MDSHWGTPNHRKRKRRRGPERPPVPAQLFFDGRLKGDVGLLSEDIFVELFPSFVSQTGERPLVQSSYSNLTCLRRCPVRRQSKFHPSHRSSSSTAILHLSPRDRPLDCHSSEKSFRAPCCPADFEIHPPPPHHLRKCAGSYQIHPKVVTQQAPVKSEECHRHSGVGYRTACPGLHCS